MRVPRTLLGASCGAVYATWYSISPETMPSATMAASCDASTSSSKASGSLPPRIVPSQPLQATAVSLSELRRWLQNRGANVTAIQFCSATADSSYAGRFGIFANAHTRYLTTRGLFGKFKALLGFNRGDVPIASFPLGATLTAPTIIQACCATQGPVLKELLEQDIIDERVAVILHLVVEKLRQRESPLRPWIALLPSKFNTPLFWNDNDLEWLKGTTLYKATQIKKGMLQDTWRRIEPVARQLTVTEGLDAGSDSPTRPTYSDFLWAYSIFWSRAISIPISSTIVLEGIVPGLDFANHSDTSKCRWTMSQFSADGGRGGRGANMNNASASPPFIQLVCPRGSTMPPGKEITINYGNKSNEELLYLYGFAQEENKHDVLMVACPLPPPSDWDETLHARVQLLRARGLSPQVFLPADHLYEASEPRKSRGRKRGRRPGDVLFEKEIEGEVEGSVAELDLPHGVMETLEVFVMEKKDVLAELHSQGGGEIHPRGAAADRAAGESRGRQSLSEIESSGLRLALLTTLVRLLELKIRELEGSTGPLEADEKLLEQAKMKLNAQQRAALIYRSGQKRLARQYLLYGNALLQQEMRHLKGLTA